MSEKPERLCYNCHTEPVTHAAYCESCYEYVSGLEDGSWINWPDEAYVIEADAYTNNLYPIPKES